MGQLTSGISLLHINQDAVSLPSHPCRGYQSTSSTTRHFQATRHLQIHCAIYSLYSSAWLPCWQRPLCWPSLPATQPLAPTSITPRRASRFGALRRHLASFARVADALHAVEDAASAS